MGRRRGSSVGVGYRNELSLVHTMPPVRQIFIPCEEGDGEKPKKKGKSRKEGGQMRQGPIKRYRRSTSRAPFWSTGNRGYMRHVIFNHPSCSGLTGEG